MKICLVRNSQKTIGCRNYLIWLERRHFQDVWRSITLPCQGAPLCISWKPIAITTYSFIQVKSLDKQEAKQPSYITAWQPARHWSALMLVGLHRPLGSGRPSQLYGASGYRNCTLLFCMLVCYFLTITLQALRLGMLKPAFLNRFSVILTFIKNILLYKANNFNFMYNTL